MVAELETGTLYYLNSLALQDKLMLYSVDGKLPQTIKIHLGGSIRIIQFYKNAHRGSIMFREYDPNTDTFIWANKAVLHNTFVIGTDRLTFITLRSNGYDIEESNLPIKYPGLKKRADQVIFLIKKV